MMIQKITYFESNQIQIILADHTFKIYSYKTKKINIDHPFKNNFLLNQIISTKNSKIHKSKNYKMSNQQKNQTLKDQLENLNSHLVMIKSLKDSQAEIQFCHLLEKAKLILGEINPHMAKFYYQYGSFLLNKVQNTMDLFNPDAVPEAEGDNLASYQSAYQEEEEDEQYGANQEKVQKKQKVEVNHAEKLQNAEKVLYEDEYLKITQNNDKMTQKMVQKPQQVGADKEQIEDDMTDLECAYQNLQAAMKIYENESEKMQNGEESVLSKEDTFNHILIIHIRLGELYMFDERFDDAIEEYNIIIKMTRGHERPEMRRKTSEAHYNIGNCLLHLNKPNCETESINQYISSHNELLKYIEEKEHYDISQIQLPTPQKTSVDRFGYLYKPFDSDLVRDMKDVMGLLLDKIEDTALQRELRPKFEKQKEKMNQLKQESGFKQVSKDVKVTNLGTFGNRKKSQPPSTLGQVQVQSDNITKFKPQAAPPQVFLQSVKQSKEQNNEKKESKEDTVEI